MTTEEVFAALMNNDKNEVKEKPKTVNELLKERRDKIKQDIADGILPPEPIPKPKKEKKEVDPAK